MAKGGASNNSWMGHVLVGDTSDPFEGVAQRFENPIPELWADDFAHPMQQIFPKLWERILLRLREVSERIQERQFVLCHSDLHEQQLICLGDNLLAVIDFGDATILDCHWDLGSALYFHGAKDFSELYASYLNSSGGDQSYPELAASFSIAIAMHHASRSRLPGKQNRLERAIRHIRKTI